MRKSQVCSRGLCLSVILMLYLCAAAQQEQGFSYKATLDSVVQNGFCTIHLSPAIIAGCQPQLEDIRIKDSSGSDIPYMIKQQSPVVITYILPLTIIATNNHGDLVLQNSSGTGTNELVLSIKNSDAVRTVTLSGSDDASHWYVIKENILLAKDSDDDKGTSFTQIIHFPYSNYSYFKLNMQGKDSLPLNIFKAGVQHTPDTTTVNYDMIPPPEVVQRDSSDKKSYIRLQFDNSYRVGQLQFSLTGAKFFSRLFALYNGNSTSNTLLATGMATSADSSITLNLGIKTNTLLLVITNLDNAPLNVSHAIAHQVPVNLVAYLDAGKKYNLFYGNAALKAPAYDLQYFGDSIHASNTPLAIRYIEKIAAPTPLEGGTHFNSWMLWSIIIAVLLLLIYFSFALLKDINRKTTNTDAHL